MQNWIKILFLTAIIPASGIYSVMAQDITPPERPHIRYVTVDTATHNTLIHWTKSPSTDVEWYYIYYEIETVNGHEGIKFDSVPANQNVYVDTRHKGNTKSYLYSVTAVDLAKNESLRLPGLHSTVHTSVQYDSCKNTISLTWNKYIGWEDNVSGYRILWRNGSGPFEILTGVGAYDSSYVHYGILENTDYAFLVEAVKNDGLVSRSNISTKFTFMPDPPELLTLDYVTVLDDITTEIAYSYSPGTTYNYALLRSSDINSDFQPVDTDFEVKASGNLFSDRFNTNSEVFYYRIGALNSCGEVFKESNIGTNIVLKADTSGQYVYLNWNEYLEWPEGVQEYRVYRKDQQNNFIELGTTGQMTGFSDDLSQIYGNGYQGEIIYYVEAIRNGSGSFSRSNTLVVSAGTKLFVPNAFTPNGDGKNDIFKPVMSFIPEKYLMIIYDRYGIPVFSTESPEVGWDGTISGKGKASEGVYVYHMQYSDYTGSQKEKTGHLTVFYP